MKTNRVVIAEWTCDGSTDTIDIDWPHVHKSAGVDHISWLLEQPISECQLVVDKIDRKLKLVAEFYSEHLLVMYHMMWAK